MEQKSKWLDRPIHPALPAITIEVLFFAIIIILAFATRFYNLGARVMSHDESLHTYFSWLLYRGQGYQHTPMMHGPWQFHMIALSYFLFGVSDFTARIPAATFGIATIFMAWYWRRYLGRVGGLVAALLLLISPFLLFYSRYVREDSYAVFAGILMLYAVLRYFETGRTGYLYLFTLSFVLHFLDKETSFIFAAQLLVFFAIYFIARVTRAVWQERPADYRFFIILLSVGIVLLVATAGVALYARESATISGTETAAPANPGQNPLSPLGPAESATRSATGILAALTVLVFAGAAFFLIRGYGWKLILKERSFDLLILTGTLVIPSLTAFVLKFSERWLHVTIPTDAASVQTLTPSNITILGIFLGAAFLISAIVGFIWNRNLWWKLALTYWVPFTVFYTTFFTNSDGFFTGTLGSLGYWLVQQGVQRGSQPWYYYLLVQIPIYEFLPAIGFIAALIMGLRLTRPAPPAEMEASPTEELAQAEEIPLPAPASEARPDDPNFINMFSLLVWWSVATIASLSYAGERMPWLTVHMTWPMILLTGWAAGRLIESVDWRSLLQHRVWVTLAVTVVFVASFINALIAWNLNPPFQGKDLAQLQATSAFLLPAVVALGSAAGLFYLLRSWTSSQISSAPSSGSPRSRKNSAKRQRVTSMSIASLSWRRTSTSTSLPETSPQTLCMAAHLRRGLPASGCL